MTLPLDLDKAGTVCHFYAFVCVDGMNVPLGRDMPSAQEALNVMLSYHTICVSL